MTLSGQNQPNTQPERPVLTAIALGLLTFVITPLVAVVLAVPSLFLGKISEAFNPILIIAQIMGFRELDGFFAAQFILIGILALIGDGAAALISWRICHIKKIAALTFFSALTFQIAAVVTIIPITVNRSQRTMQVGIDRENAYQQYATLGDMGYKVHGPFSDREITNLHPEYGPLYKKLEIIIPISVSHAGAYRVSVEYGFSNQGMEHNTQMKTVKRTLDVKDHLVQIEFAANEAGGSYGHWSPDAVDGHARVQLSYLASEKGVLDKLKSDSSIDERTLNQFMKDEGIGKRSTDEQTIAKFVAVKETAF